MAKKNPRRLASDFVYSLRIAALQYFIFVSSQDCELVSQLPIECVIYLIIMFLVMNIATRTKGGRMVNNVIICDLQAKDENEE